MIIEYLNGRCKELRKKSGIDISPATFEKYERSSRFVIHFLGKEFKVKNYALVKVDSRFLEEYFQYLRSVRKIGNNTAVKYMTFLRTLLMPAIHAGVIRQNPFRGLKFRIKTVPKGFLTDEDIDMLYYVALDSPDLARIRVQEPYS